MTDSFPTFTAHPIFARCYAVLSPAMDRGGVIEHRRRLLAGLTGDVVEIGVGNGLNFAHYPTSVTRVVAIEPEPHLRELARRAAVQAPVPIEVRDGVAEQLPVEDSSVDAAVACLMLCSVSDQQAALREMYRVVRPGGQLRFLEHVRAARGPLRHVQHLVDTTCWPLLFGGCHTGRDTVAAVTAAGFTLQHLERFRVPATGVPHPASPHVLGTAIRPHPAV
ncbi:MAG: class I SAM-dependent methyltransferase [Pseudonocardiaceae bacterium]